MRIKRGVASSKKHKKILKANKGYRMTKNRLIKVAKEAYLHAGEYAYQGRKQKKRTFRRTWITRISEAVKKEGLNYSKFIFLLKENKIEVNRKILASFITDHPDVFEHIVNKVKK